jgi:hypothetical protein
MAELHTALFFVRNLPIGGTLTIGATSCGICAPEDPGYDVLEVV